MQGENRIPKKLDTSLTISQQNSRYVYRFIKRSCDIVFSLLGILIFLVPGFLIACAIKWENPKGTIFYTQTRVGKYQILFKMYKFRSMLENADSIITKLKSQNEVDGAMFKMKHDPRVTKVGHFLRRHSLDEIPQLWNVFKGDMSLVGPRPPLEREVVQYTDYDKQRLSVKPGCTGLWQVSGRNNVGFHEMVELDLKYIKERGLYFDFKIILQTIKIIIFPNNAF